MDKKEITININELNTEELEALAKILYDHNHMKECKEVNNRHDWILYG